MGMPLKTTCKTTVGVEYSSLSYVRPQLQEPYHPYFIVVFSAHKFWDSAKGAGAYIAFCGLGSINLTASLFQYEPVQQVTSAQWCLLVILIPVRVHFAAAQWWAFPVAVPELEKLWKAPYLLHLLQFHKGSESELLFKWVFGIPWMLLQLVDLLGGVWHIPSR